MTEHTAAFLFRQNQMEVCPAIAPAGQTNLGMVFGNAAQKFTLQPAHPEVANNDNQIKMDKLHLAGDANLVGDALKDSMQGVKCAPQNPGSFGEFLGATCKIAAEYKDVLNGKPGSAPDQNQQMDPAFMQRRPGMSMAAGPGFGSIG